MVEFKRCSECGVVHGGSGPLSKEYLEFLWAEQRARGEDE